MPLILAIFDKSIPTPDNKKKKVNTTANQATVHPLKKKIYPANHNSHARQ
jgi:hypothetical protein